MKKLLLAAALIGVFTLNGVSSIQLVAVIAFSAGVYSARFLPGTSNRTLEDTAKLNDLGQHRVVKSPQCRMSIL